MGIYSIVFDRDTREFSEHGGADARDALYSCVEMGDLAQFEKVFQAFDKALMSLTKNDRTHYKFTIQYVMAQLELVAVRGGLSLMECNELEDRYYRELENTATPEEAVSLLKSHCRALTGMIAECRELSPITRECRSYVQNHLYEDLSLFQNRIIYYESSRGCPFSCSYCMSSTEKRVRLRSLDKVFGELAFFMRAGVPQVKFTDRTFNCSPERTRRIWSWLLEHDNGITNFHFEIEANLLDEDLLALLGRMRPGLVQTEIGVQSVNPLTLRAVSRNEDVARILHSAEVIRKNGNMHLHLDLIAGLPYEDYASMRESFRAVYSIHPHELQLGFLKLLKGCGLYRDKEEFGIVSSPFAPYEVLKTRWLSYEDILRLKGVERVLEIYYNSAQYPCTIRALERYFPDPLSLFEELADFCGEKDGTAHSGSRLAQTALLHAFACTLAPEEEKAWNERTVLDLYLRENAKSRPQWAEDPSGMRDQLHSFWEQEERTGNLFPEFRGKRAGTLKRMFHMERFTRICEEAALTTGNETAKKAVKEGLYPALWLLFDYRHRDPVTGNARTLLLAEGADGRIFSL